MCVLQKNTATVIISEDQPLLSVNKGGSSEIIMTESVYTDILRDNAGPDRRQPPLIMPGQWSGIVLGSLNYIYV